MKGCLILQNLYIYLCIFIIVMPVYQKYIMDLVLINLVNSTIATSQFPNLKGIECNLIAGSWFPFHQFFNGLNTFDENSGISDVPLIRISPNGMKEQFIDEGPNRRQRVN